jgi:uncharacterized damage-inducible protein DinB
LSKPSGDRLIDHLRMMARNNAWANHKLLAACVALGPEEFGAPRVGFFPSIRETLTHLYLVDQYYLDALEEGGLGRAVYGRAVPFDEPGHLREAQKISDRRLIDFCDGLAPDDLDWCVLTDRGPAGSIPERATNLLAHLFQHQIHHRGQAHAMLAGTLVHPPQLDEFFLDYDRDPAAARIMAK